MRIRNVLSEDYARVNQVLDNWWGGRPMTHLLPRLFFDHFQPTSFVIEEDKELVAFLIGFISQTNPKESYIHFVGVKPLYRKQGLANRLYVQFFNTVRGDECTEVKCITTPINSGSIAFHKAIGFDAQLVEAYAGEGQDRIVFSKML